MSQDDNYSVILLADIVGSTSLYERIGDKAAARQIGEFIETLRSIAQAHEGSFVHSKGDDMMCTFDMPSFALRAASEMLSYSQRSSLSIHGGLNFGSVVRAPGDIFGDAVNLTARLASMAKAGEVLVSQSVVDRLPEEEQKLLRTLDKVIPAGKKAPTLVYSLTWDDTLLRTEIASGHGHGNTRIRFQEASPNLSIELRYLDKRHSCVEGASVSIGRSRDCQFVINEPWISRNHATLSVVQGKLQLTDQSLSGTYVSSDDGQEFFMRRESVLLTGSGVISPAKKVDEAGAVLIRYETRRSRAD